MKLLFANNINRLIIFYSYNHSLFSYGLLEMHKPDIDNTYKNLSTIAYNFYIKKVCLRHLQFTFVLSICDRLRQKGALYSKIEK